MVPGLSPPFLHTAYYQNWTVGRPRNRGYSGSTRFCNLFNVVTIPPILSNHLYLIQPQICWFHGNQLYWQVSHSQHSQHTFKSSAVRESSLAVISPGRLSSSPTASLRFILAPISLLHRLRSLFQLSVWKRTGVGEMEEVYFVSDTARPFAELETEQYSKRCLLNTLWHICFSMARGETMKRPTVVTIQWLQRDQIVPLSAKSVGSLDSLFHLACSNWDQKGINPSTG